MKLLLFDIDGTLIDSGGAGTRSLDLAFREVLSIPAAFKDISMAGKTDIQIIKEGLVTHGLPSDDGLVPALVGSYIRHLRIEIVTPRKHTKPGVREVLRIISEQHGEWGLGLLTGNLEQGARIKLVSLSLNRYFPSGAFGSDHEDRNKLLPIAVERFQTRTAERINFRDCIVVGDTPRDVHCAKPYGARCIAVATGPYPRKSLSEAGADFTLDNLSDADAFLRMIEGM